MGAGIAQRTFDNPRLVQGFRLQTLRFGKGMYSVTLGNISPLSFSLSFCVSQVKSSLSLMSGIIFARRSVSDQGQIQYPTGIADG